MKFVIAINLLVLAVSYGCKPVDQNQSEDKGLASALKKGGKYISTRQLPPHIATEIHSSVADALDTGDFSRIKKLLSQGGKVAGETIITFHRSYTKAVDDWAHQIKHSIDKIKTLDQSVGMLNGDKSKVIGLYKAEVLELKVSTGEFIARHNKSTALVESFFDEGKNATAFALKGFHNFKLHNSNQNFKIITTNSMLRSFSKEQNDLISSLNWQKDFESLQDTLQGIARKEKSYSDRFKQEVEINYATE